MDKSDVKILEEEIAYSGYASVKRYKISHKLFEGGWSEPFWRELLVRNDAVAVLPYDPNLGRVVLVEQFRVGALKDKKSPWQLELPAGIIDKDLPKEDIAKLELKEEANLDIESLIPIYTYLPSPGISSEYVHLYCAMVDSKKAKGIHGLKEEHENILVHVMDKEDAFNAIKTGVIKNAFTIIALQWLKLQHFD